MNRCFRLFAWSFVFLLLACSRAPLPDTSASQSIGILVFGDSGYHLDYPDQDDFDDLFTDEGYRQHEWDDWVEDKRPQDEFEARPQSISPVTGKTVLATGLPQISAAMKHFCANIARCDFGVMLGDNIYPSGATFGADGIDDAQRFKDMFTDPFGSLVSDPDSYLTYVTLGNHDWETSRAGGFAQIEFLQEAQGFYIDGPYYTVKPPAFNGDIELFIIDTSMMLASTTVHVDYLNDDGSEATTDEIDWPDYNVEPLTDADRAQPQWLEAALQASTAKWKLVVAHHPIWSSSGSKFEQAKVLREMLLPALCRYADAYIVGHDHTLEIHSDSCERALGKATAEPLVQIVSGAAAKQRPTHTTFMQHQDRKYPEHKTIMAEGLLWGFAHLTLNGDVAEVTMMKVPDDGSSDITVSHVYQFPRRSHLTH
ncbi:MAG: metallophosphoesterase [Proteobacteria bacterium]|nr:metallophosphoesterase [Pseudomonadota bacterium]